jgi:competence protein ComEC
MLKVPHHGAADPAVPAFIEAVSPELAIISVGRNNPWGHPADETLRELDRVGAKVMRTDRDGAITITVRPPRWWASGSSPRARRQRITGEMSGVGVGEG